jgi:hypothetical protein
MLLSLLAACGSGGSEPATTIATTTTTAPSATEEAAPTAVVPVGYIPFAVVDADNAVTVQGLSYLVNSVGETVVVQESTSMTANLTNGKITSVTAGPDSFAVVVVEEDGVRTLYGKGGASENDPDTIDLTPLAPVNAATTKAGSAKTGTTTTKKSTAAQKTSTALAKPQPIKTTASTTLLDKDAAYQQQKEALEKKDITPEERRIALNLLSYMMDENGIFYVEHQPWQKQFGFNTIYDAASPLIQLVYGTVRVKFRYGYVYKLYTEGEKKGQVIYDAQGNPTYETDAAGKPIPKDWMVQLWKGRYGLVMIGAEIGVYTKPSTQSTQHYYSAVEEEELIMAMDVYQDDLRDTAPPKHLFTRGPESHWWLTGFVPGSFYEYNKKSEVILVGNIQFPNAEMLSAFEKPFAAAGFSKGSPGRDNPETYTTSGNSIKFSWQYIDQDA